MPNKSTVNLPLSILKKDPLQFEAITILDENKGYRIDLQKITGGVISIRCSEDDLKELENFVNELPYKRKESEFGEIGWVQES